MTYQSLGVELMFTDSNSRTRFWFHESLKLIL